MKLHTSLLSLISLVALPLASFAGQPSGGTTTTVAFGGTAIPGGAQATSYVISKPGSYYLAGDRSMTADVSAIVVNSPDVTIDLNGCAISFTGGSAANGIEIPATNNVEIRNGSINDVPADAIKAVGGSGLRVIDVKVTTAGKFGLECTAGLVTVDRCSFSYCGQDGVYIFNSYNGAQVKNSHLVQNGRHGIFVGGNGASEVSGCRVEKNQRSGISVNGEGSVVANNIVHQSNLSKSTSDGGIVVASWSTVRGNSVVASFVNGILVTDNGSTVDNNAILCTSNAAGNSNLGNAITLTWGGGAYTNNRISPTSNAIVGSLVNGGGNVLY